MAVSLPLATLLCFTLHSNNRLENAECSLTRLGAPEVKVQVGCVAFSRMFQFMLNICNSYWSTFMTRAVYKPMISWRRLAPNVPLREWKTLVELPYQLSWMWLHSMPECQHRLVSACAAVSFAFFSVHFSRATFQSSMRKVIFHHTIDHSNWRYGTVFVIVHQIYAYLSAIVLELLVQSRCFPQGT